MTGIRMSDSPKRYWMSVVERDGQAGLVDPASREAENGDPDFTCCTTLTLTTDGITRFTNGANEGI